MKILSKYILKEHAGPFCMATAIITFVMLLDRILDLLDLVIRKHLPILSIIKIFSLSLPFMLALAIPMAVLVGTIMAFGRLSSDHEITAFKASGINIYRMISPVVITALLLSFFMIYFNNHILPDSNFALKNMLLSVHSRQPASELKPGIFTKLQDYNFYFHDIDESSGMYNRIIIYDKSPGSLPRTITAQKGKITLSNGGNSLKALLYDGEIHETNNEKPQVHTAMTFRSYVIALPDLGTKEATKRYAKRGDREMGAADMKKKVTILKSELAAETKALHNAQHQLETYLSDQTSPEKTNREYRRLTNIVNMKTDRTQNINKEISKYAVEIHKKYSIAFACLVFILIGAPIGMMTRTNSVGMGFATSSFIFLVYYISLYAGEELADQLIVSPFIAMWISNIIFTIVGIYLVVLSVKERRIIHIERLKNLFSKKSHEKLS